MILKLDNDLQVKKKKLKKVLSLILGLIIIICIVSYIVIYAMVKRFEKDFFIDYATAFATDPSISAPGECGTSLDCVGPIEIDKNELYKIGLTAVAGNLAVNLVRANFASNNEDNQQGTPGYTDLELEFLVENLLDDETHYGGPVYESQLQDYVQEYPIESAEPQSLMEVVAFPPGKKVGGRLVYNVPAVKEKYYWVFRDRMSGYQIVFEIPTKR
jgi:hypothetical protein